MFLSEETVVPKPVGRVGRRNKREGQGSIEYLGPFPGAVGNPPFSVSSRVFPLKHYTFLRVVRTTK